MENNIEDAINLLKKNGYVVKKWTKRMEKDADECALMEEKGESKDCCECTCSVCLLNM